MASRPDLSLPTKIPEMAQYHETNLLPFALYALCDLDERELAQLRTTCQSECQLNPGQEQVLFPPQSQFPGKPLREIVDYHIDLARNGEFDPRYFIVAVYPNWKRRVLIVTLNDEELICRPDSVWNTPQESALTLVNLQISNMDWDDVKEGAEFDERENQDGGDYGDEDDKYGPPPAHGYRIAVYVTEDVDAKALLSAIEPGLSTGDKSPKNIACKITPIPSSDADADADPVTRAAASHPFQADQHPTLYKRMFLVAGRDFPEDGLDLVDLDDESTRHVLKVEASCNQMMVSAVPLFATIASKGGYEAWEPKHVLLGAYPVRNDEGCHIGLAKAVDSRWSRRGHGEERVVLGQVVEGDGELGFWRKAIRAHLCMVRDLRFAVNFCWEYFVAGERDTDPRESVLIARLDWEGSTKRRDLLEMIEGLGRGDPSSQLEKYSDRVSFMRCPGGDAHKIVTDLKTGRAWEGSVAF